MLSQTMTTTNGNVIFSRIRKEEWLKKEETKNTKSRNKCKRSMSSLSLFGCAKGDIGTKKSAEENGITKERK